jgi:hypothetical protein
MDWDIQKELNDKMAILDCQIKITTVVYLFLSQLKDNIGNHTLEIPKEMIRVSTPQVDDIKNTLDAEFDIIIDGDTINGFIEPNSVSEPFKNIVSWDYTFNDCGNLLLEKSKTITSTLGADALEYIMKSLEAKK